MKYFRQANLFRIFFFKFCSVSMSMSSRVLPESEIVKHINLKTSFIQLIIFRLSKPYLIRNHICNDIQPDKLKIQQRLFQKITKYRRIVIKKNECLICFKANFYQRFICFQIGQRNLSSSDRLKIRFWYLTFFYVILRQTQGWHSISPHFT